MADMNRYSKYWKEGTANSADKLVEKYADKASEAVQKLKDPKTQAAWKQNVSSDATAKRYAKSINKLNSADMIQAMEEKGKAAFVRATSSDLAQAKWEKNTAAYVDVAQSVSKNKKPIVTEQDAVDNFLALRRAMMKKKEELG